jgi:peptidyl-prolyl cis-trans isomerase B (cyclophilin B)
MIQGGDPDSKTASATQTLGMGGPGYEIPAEIGALHIKGALAAARTQNPEKKSSGSQFYIVQGQPVSAQQLDQMAAGRGGTYTDIQKELYMELGGTPQLDFDYTVFGEVVEGLEVIDLIAKVATNRQLGDRPVEDVRMTVKILK